MKPWWRSKTIWAGIIVTLRGVYLSLQQTLPAFTHVQLPPIPPELDAVLTLMVGTATIHGRVTADTKIGNQNLS